MASFARVCTYDRAGLGWSEASPKARTASNIVEEFRTLLTRAGVQPPYVLVGHSAGGLYMQLYAHAHPDDVAAMVLVDSAHSEMDVRSPESLVKLNKRAFTVMGCGFRFLQMLCSIGLLALVPDWVSRIWFNPIPEETRETYIGVACSGPRWLEAARRKAANVWGNLAEARAAQITALGKIPLVVLSRGRGQMTPGPGVSAEDFDSHSRLWYTLFGMNVPSGLTEEMRRRARE
jgi:pimeloyl-ACP methyl ester carboxylesterase